MDVRICRVCGASSEDREFKVGRSICLPCDRAVQREQHAASRTQRNIARARRSGIVITAEDEQRLDSETCAICGTQGVPLVIDHDHETGKVRDYLCSPCNWGLGNLRDDPRLLEKAAEYLRNHGRV